MVENENILMTKFHFEPRALSIASNMAHIPSPLPPAPPPSPPPRLGELVPGNKRNIHKHNKLISGVDLNNTGQQCERHTKETQDTDLPVSERSAWREGADV